MSGAIGPRRTLLFLPALAERFIAGAHEKGTRTVMLDLEDLIPPEQKQAAREALPEAVASLRSRGLEVWIRLNNRPEHLWRDVDACVLDGVAGLMLPKTETPGDVAALHDGIARAGSRAGLAPGRVAVSAQIETPVGVLSAQAISGGPRLAALAWGGEDYAAPPWAWRPACRVAGTCGARRPGRAGGRARKPGSRLGPSRSIAGWRCSSAPSGCRAAWG